MEYRELYFAWKYLAFVLVLLLPGIGQSAVIWYGAEFSADITMTSVKNPDNKGTGKIYVGRTKVRAEGSHKGETKVVLIDAEKQKAWTLLPDKKQYYEGMGDAPMPTPDSAVNPCNPPRGNYRCQKMAEEEINGVTAEKWQYGQQLEDGQVLYGTAWFDPIRKIVVRNQITQGPVMERLLKGKEQVNGRMAEVWELRGSFQGETRSSTMWVDRALNVAIRIEGKGEFTGDLTHIQEGSQPENLFVIPSDYQQVLPPWKQTRQ